MSIPKVAFCIWGANEEERALVDKIAGVFIDTIAKTEVIISVRDLKTYELNEEFDFYVAFGSLAQKSLEHSFLAAPSLASMLGTEAITYKTETMNILNALWQKIKLEDKSSHTTAVETPEGITVGGLGADIIITEKEAEHLKKVKDLLGGGKMVITKGNLRIEVGE